MSKITLIGKSQAKIGNKFIFYKSSPDCEKCNLKQTCVDNLQEGRLYEIVGIRPKEHDCNFFEDKVVVVEVIQPPIDVLINAKISFEGAILTFNPIESIELDEDLLKYQNPPGLKSGDKCKILKIYKDIKGKKSKFKLAQLELVSTDSF